MEEVSHIPSEILRPYVQSITVMESKDYESHTNLPFYADGLPGIMFQQSENGCFLLPRNKELSELFLYGQTLEPISIDIKGTFRFVVFQLYPFASKYLLDVHPKELNDDCFDLLQLDYVPSKIFANRLKKTTNFKQKISILSELMVLLIKNSKTKPDDRIQNAIYLILQNKGRISIKDVRNQVFLTERTLERKFINQVGLTPKQFAKIIQFKSSLHQLTESNFGKFLKVGLDSGFSDQSHFIRVFKKYTGKTPSAFFKENST